MSRIAVLYNDDGALAGGTEADRIAVQAVVGMARAVSGACRARGHEAHALACPRDPAQMLAELRALAPDLVFHFVESIDGDPRHEAHVAGLLELAGIAYTGTPPAAIALGLDKPLAKALLRSRGVPTPDWTVVECGDEAVDISRAGAPPWIVKPAREDASHGITRESLVRTEAAAIDQSRKVIERYGPALIEQYVEGREFNVAILGEGASAECLPLGEIDFSGLPAGHPPILTYEAKWEETSPAWIGSPSVAARPLLPQQEQSIREVALAAYRAVGLRDYGRVDLRLCPRRGPLVMEVNPNPDLSPDAGFAKAAARAGMSYEDLIAHIAGLAFERTQHIRLRELRASDRADLERILRATAAFSPAEIGTALELIDAGLGQQAEDPYLFLVAQDARGRVQGYACYGHRPGTRGDWDLYWIAVDPAAQGGGLGQHLLHAVEVAAHASGGARLIAETASKPSYAATRAFYERCGYTVVECERDYYALGDDKLVYARELR